MDNTTVILIVIGVGALALMTQRWFWALVGGLGALASFFAMVASVIHFQILGAMGFFFLMCICGGILSVATDGM